MGERPGGDVDHGEGPEHVGAGPGEGDAVGGELGAHGEDRDLTSVGGVRVLGLVLEWRGHRGEDLLEKVCIAQALHISGGGLGVGIGLG